MDLGHRSISLQQSPYARMADGAAIASIGDTSVLCVTVSRTDGQRSSLPFLPLTVEYRLKAAAAGRIPTNFLKREMAPTVGEILSARMIDRSIRPLFPPAYNFDTQVTCNMLAIDPEFDPDVVSINAASAALALSNIPWNGPLGAVRVGMVDDQLTLNPNRTERAKSTLNLIIAAVERGRVLMIDGSADRIPLFEMEKALHFGLNGCMDIIRGIKQLQKEAGKEKKTFEAPEPISGEVMEATRTLLTNRLVEIFSDSTHDKISRDVASAKVRQEVVESLKESFPDVLPPRLSQAVGMVSKEVFRNLIFERKLRVDGRALDELRQISCSIDLYATLHGSALFQRGQTQVMSTLAFDSISSALRTDSMSALMGGVKEKNFFLHYEFPQYATNELSRGPAFGRRELGHGALAEKALRPLIPAGFPFTIRLTAEVLESNGSSSMASVCAGSLSLMDAGVPISEAAAGVAVGLVTRPKNPQEVKDVSQLSEQEIEHLVLTDLLGLEDYSGDMDFKVAGTRSGITALQLDLKLAGIPGSVLIDALQKAVVAKKKVLDIMDETISQARPEKKANAPVLQNYEVPPNKRGRFVGVGGLALKKITVETGVQVNHVEDNTYELFAPNEQSLKEAVEMIESNLAESDREISLEFGAIYTAKIVELRDIGVMVTLYPTMSPVLLHNSQLDRRKIAHPTALGLEVGQELKVKYFGRDPVSGVMRLSRKILLSPGAGGVVQNLNPRKEEFLADKCQAG